MAQQEHGEKSDEGRLHRSVRVVDKTLRIAAVLAFVAVGIAMALNLPATPATKPHPSFLDNIFASRITLFVARAVLVEGAIFLVVSMTIRTLQGDWATKAGPVDTSASNNLSDAVEELDSWKDRTAQAEAKVDDLEGRLRETEEALKCVLRDLEAAEAKLRDEGTSG